MAFPNNNNNLQLRVIAFDSIAILILFLILCLVGFFQLSWIKLFSWWGCYLISVQIFPSIALDRIVRISNILNRIISTSLLMVLLFQALRISNSGNYLTFSKVAQILLYTILTLSLSRFFIRYLAKYSRAKGYNSQSVVFVGAGINLLALYKSMGNMLSTGYKIQGYFENKDSARLGQVLPRLGEIKDVIPYLAEHKPDLLFCNLPSHKEKEILEIINYCEDNFIDFFSVPNVHNYVRHTMTVQFIGDMPILALRPEPLQQLHNRIIKRTFDVVFSGLFLLLCFWWIAIFVAIITKITMPGPVFFFQKRNGFNGKEFNCIKFRTMKVNANSDKVQATENDPRKTKWGNIMRKTNIDELPQFINVFLGQMSVVGPRPHMVYHTETYRNIIKGYMVRHNAKPGITGYAQVTGSRGETPELWMMEERIEKDIYYIEHWTIWLDIKIISLTIYNALGGEKGNAY